MFKLFTPSSPIELTPYLEADFRNEAIRQAVTEKMLSRVMASSGIEIVLAHSASVSSSTLEITKHEMVRPIPTPFHFRNLHGLGQLFITLDTKNPIDPKNFGTPHMTFSDLYGENTAIVLQAGADDPTRKFATVVATAYDPVHPAEPNIYLATY